MATSRICSIADCGKPARTHGWCNSHYTRWRKHGDPLAGKTFWGAPEHFYQGFVLPYEGNECLIWPYSRNTNGSALMPSKSGTDKVVCRRLCEDVNGPPPTPKHEAAHSCGKGHLACVTKGHLSWKTHAENIADKSVHDTNLRGERSPQSRLVEDEVRQIRALRGTIYQRDIAARFGVSEATISNILHGTAWGWLP